MRYSKISHSRSPLNQLNGIGIILRIYRHYERYDAIIRAISYKNRFQFKRVSYHIVAPKAIEAMEGLVRSIRELSKGTLV
jgi:hypothetical protein